MCSSGDRFVTKFWERILTIAVEDIGPANPQACIISNCLKSAYYFEYENQDDALIQAIFAAMYLSSSVKDRTIDELKNYFKLFKPIFKIPDYALDKHTKRGKQMGRDDLHFWEKATQLKPELKYRNKKYLKKILQNIKSDASR